MNDATYTAWDDNTYPWPPPGGWYQAVDGRWWPEGYGPQTTTSDEASISTAGSVSESSTADTQGAESSTTAAASSAVDSVAATTASPSPGSLGSSDNGDVGFWGERSSSSTPLSSSPDSSTVPAAASSATDTVADADTARTSSSKIFQRMQREAAAKSGRSWSGSEAATEAPNLTGGADDSVSDSAFGIIDRHDAATGAAASTAALGAAAYSGASPDTTTEAATDSAVDTTADVAAGEADVVYQDNSGHYGTQPAPHQEYAEPDPARGDYSAAGVSDPTTFDQTIPVQVPPPDHGDSGRHTYADQGFAGSQSAADPGYGSGQGFSDSGFGTDHGQAEPGFADRGYDVAAPEPVVPPGFETSDPVVPPGFEAPEPVVPTGFEAPEPVVPAGFETPSVDGGYQSDAVQADSASIDAPDGQAPADKPTAERVAPWDDPSVDTAVNPVVRPRSIAVDAPDTGPTTTGDFLAPRIGGPDDLRNGDDRVGTFDPLDDGSRQPDRGPLLAPPTIKPRRRRGKGLLFGLIGLLALAAAGGAGFLFHQQQQGEPSPDSGDTAATAEATSAVPGSFSNPHDPAQAVQIEYSVEDVAQVWTIQATSAALTDLGGSTEVQTDLNVSNGNASGSAALADLVVSIVGSDEQVLAEGVGDCAEAEMMPWGQSVAGGTSVSGPVCWVVPTDSLDGALLAIESTKANGRIYIRLPQ